MRLVNSFVSLLAGLTLAGCAGRQEFTPTDRVTSLSPAGYPAAEYDVDSTLGEFSDAKVWSRGAYSQKIAGEKRTVVHVGFEIENHMNQPIQFDARGVRLDSLATDKATLGDIAPGWVKGDPTLGAQESKRLDVYFVLPSNLSPGDVDGFRVRWALDGALQHYAQRTPFLKEAGGNYSGPTAGSITSEEPDNSKFYDRSEIVEPQQGGPPSISAPLGGPGLP